MNPTSKIFTWTPQSGLCEICGKMRNRADHTKCSKIRLARAKRLNALAIQRSNAK